MRAACVLFDSDLIRLATGYSFKETPLCSKTRLEDERTLGLCLGEGRSNRACAMAQEGQAVVPTGI